MKWTIGVENTKDFTAIRVTEAKRLKHWFEDDPQATSSQTARGIYI